MMNINRANLLDMVMASEMERLSTLNFEEYEMEVDAIFHSDENELFQTLVAKIIDIFSQLEKEHEPIYIGNADSVKFTTMHTTCIDTLTGEPWEIIEEAFSVYGLFDVSYEYGGIWEWDYKKEYEFSYKGKNYNLIYDYQNECYFIN